ncbi:MAG: chaperone modulator CbpM [Ignavibacteriota bacterium]
MNDQTLLLLSDCATGLGVDISFFIGLESRGLIHTITKDEILFLEISELPRLEKIFRFQDELDINLEGIEAITHLLDRMEVLQEKITSLENQLRVYQ